MTFIALTFLVPCIFVAAEGLISRIKHTRRSDAFAS
jgi:hypothetical protein